MEFEFDADKSAANAAKHGIDFDQAQRLWQDSLRVEIPPERLTSPDGSWSGGLKVGTVRRGDPPAGGHENHLGPPFTRRGGGHL
ncbi:MAG TPA: hypothetical protein VM324_09860 [Egibacteraceae bacterium]|nr:hypothetical protein [Egibacteraceae bacterium]